MSTYTGCDIELRFNNVTAGMDTTGLDEEKSCSRYEEMVERAIQAAYPQYSVCVNVYADTIGSNLIDDALRACPEDVDPADIDAISDRVWESGDWYVTATCATCGASLADVRVPDAVPAKYDEEAWNRLAQHHTPDCQWIKTRAGRLNDDGSDPWAEVQL